MPPSYGAHVDDTEGMEKVNTSNASGVPLGSAWEGRLDEWLANVGKYDPYGAEDSEEVPTWSFPTDTLVREYVTHIDIRPEEQVLHLLRCFLFENVTFGGDWTQLEILTQLGDKDLLRRFAATEHGKRLLRRPEAAHPGVRWVLDLLPANPQRALDVIDAYVIAHGMTLPDGRLSGLWDASTLISARYMSRKSENGADGLRRLSPRQLEQLTARLYSEMGYHCELTQATRDGGRDVIAKIDSPGRREHRVIDCAHYVGTVPVTKARAILGVADREHATSAVLLTTGRISPTTRQEAAANNKLDLVDGVRLVQMLDEHLGPDWPQSLDYWIQWPARS